MRTSYQLLYLLPLVLLCVAHSSSTLTVTAQSCGFQGYDLSCLSGTDFVATSPLEAGYYYWFRPCAVEQSFLPCGRVDTTNPMLCQSWNNGTRNYSIALWNPSAMNWSTVNDSQGGYQGVGFVVNNGDGGGCGDITHRTAVVSFICDVSDSRQFVINGDVEGSCTYYFSLSTSLVCPGMARSCSASTSSSLSSGAKAGIAIGVLIGVAVLVLIAAVLWRRRTVTGSRGGGDSESYGESADG